MPSNKTTKHPLLPTTTPRQRAWRWLRRYMLLALLALLSMATPAHAEFTHDDPLHPDRLAVSIIVYLGENHVVADVDGVVLEIDDQLLEIDFGERAELTVWFILPDPYAALFVSRNGELVQTLEGNGDALGYTIRAEEGVAWGFEIERPDGDSAPAPTVPDIVLVPVKDKPARP